jgi:predicted Fe-S protein YdhL (DUF1289 family)
LYISSPTPHHAHWAPVKRSPIGGRRCGLYRRRRTSVGDGLCLPRGDLYLAHHIRADDPMSDIESPCNKVCAVDPISALCIGCGRTLAEIEGWMRMGADERVRIMAQLPRRLAALGRRHTARAGVG